MYINVHIVPMCFLIYMYAEHKKIYWKSFCYLSELMKLKFCYLSELMKSKFENDPFLLHSSQPSENNKSLADHYSKISWNVYFPKLFGWKKENFCVKLDFFPILKQFLKTRNFIGNFFFSFCCHFTQKITLFLKRQKTLS